MKRTLSLLLVLAAALAAGASAGQERAGHSCVRGGELWFRAADGTKLVGHRFGKGAKGVVLAHQSNGDLCEWLPYARELAGQGYFVFAIDLRGHGFSSAGPTRRMGRDVTAAVKELRKLGKTKVLVVGASMGGLAGLVGAANARPQVDGVVALSAPAQFIGMNGVATASALRAPVLYVAAEDDAGGRFARDARVMFPRTASADKALEVVPGGLHGVELLQRTPAVKQLVASFLRSH